MSYSLTHLKFTIHYIINKLQYADHNLKNRNLSASVREHLAEALFVAIHPQQERNPKKIFINQENGYLTEFFMTLRTRGIELPSNTFYLLKQKGISYECVFENNEETRTEIYNRQKERDKFAAQRENELTTRLCEQLSDLTYESSDDEENDQAELSYTPRYSTLGDYLSNAVIRPTFTGKRPHSAKF